MASVLDKFSKTFNSTNPNVARVSSTRSGGGATLVCDNLAGWPTDTVVHFSTYQVSTGGAVVAGTQIDWKGVVSGNTVTSLTRVAGATDSGNAINDYVEMNPTASWANDLATGLLVEHDQDGTHKSVTTDTLTTTGNVSIGGTLTIAGSTSDGGWTPISGTISAVTANGNRSYSLTTSSDNTASISPGMRLRTTRTVSAPTQSASLNGSSQYFSKSSPAGTTFTDDFVVSAWVKVSAYQLGTIASRYNGTSGWELVMQANGTVYLQGYNGGSGNYSGVVSYQSLPLNKWVHIAAQLDMSTFTATTTTSYVMFDGVDVPCVVSRGGTNPTALVQAGDINIGAANGATFFPGKIAQVAIYSAKVTQANIRATISQGLSGTETSLVSAYSLSNSVTDLNTSNANNLTAQNSAATTNADSPFGGQAGGTISATLDYGEVTSVTSNTIVVRANDTSTIPTAGGISAVSYSSSYQPYGMPIQSNVLGHTLLCNSFSTAATSPTQISGLSVSVTIPAGGAKVKITIYTMYVLNTTASAANNITLWDGTVGSGTQLTLQGVTTPINGSATPLTAQWVGTVPAGSKTYNAAIHTNTGTTSFYGAADSPGFILVELI